MKFIPLITTILLVLFIPGSQARADDIAQQAQRLLAKHCFVCHGPDRNGEDAKETDLRLDLLTAGRRGGDFVSCQRLFMVGCLDKGGIVTIAGCRGSVLLVDNPAYPQSEIQYLVSAHGTLDTHALCVADLFPLHILEGIISTVIESANKLNAARRYR